MSAFIKCRNTIVVGGIGPSECHRKHEPMMVHSTRSASKGKGCVCHFGFLCSCATRSQSHEAPLFVGTTGMELGGFRKNTIVMSCSLDIFRLGGLLVYDVCLAAPNVVRSLLILCNNDNNKDICLELAFLF